MDFSLIGEMLASSIRMSVRHWNGGDHLAHIDDLQVTSSDGTTTYLSLGFSSDGGPWANADGSNWENLCVYCHEDEHSRSVLGDYFNKGR